MDKKNLWFQDLQSGTSPKIRLFCFPFAGGNAYTYRSWNELLPDSICVCPVQYPGRANRIKESRYTDLLALTDALHAEIESFLDLPIAVFGHSMGAIVGFELICLLQKRGVSIKHLFVSGARAPGTSSDRQLLHNLSPDNFRTEILRLNGTPKEILDHPELFEILLPILRDDFQMIETYSFSGNGVINCPITVFGGDSDPEVNLQELNAWSNFTSSSFKSKVFNGDHFFLFQFLKEISNIIKHDLKDYL